MRKSSTLLTQHLDEVQKAIEPKEIKTPTHYSGIADGLKNQHRYIDPSKPRRRYPDRIQTPLQSLSTELNWDLAILSSTTLQLSHLCEKYGFVFEKVLLKQVPAADVVHAINAAIKTSIQKSREHRTKKIKEKQALDRQGDPG